MHKKLLSILALTILVTSTLVGCSGASSTTSTLTILSITEGQVFVMKAGTDDWTKATVDMSLEVGDTIKTGDDSGAEITFFDGSTIELEAGTHIEITALDSSPDTGAKTITLMQTIGTTISRVTKLLDPASSYAVETPSGVAAVRGTIMIVRIVFDDPNYEDGTVLVTSVEGQVYFIGHGVELPVPEGGQVVAGNETVEVILANELSLAVDDSAVTDEDTPVTVAAPGVLGNDSGVIPGDTLTVTAWDTSGTVGTVTSWGADGSFTYDPDGQFEYLQTGGSATDSSTYLVSDGHGGIDTATVTITVDGINDAPTDIGLDNSSIAENQPAGTSVGSFSTTDPDTGDTSTYSLVSGEGGHGNGWFMIVGSQLRTAASFNYESSNSYSIRVRTTDSGGLYYEKVFVITVADVYEPPVVNPPVNHAPTAISLDNSSVAENQPPGTPVGSFSTTDPDTGGSFTYTLVSGNGSTDNGSFNISGSNLRTSTTFDYETTNSSSIRVRSTDQGGLWVEEHFTITVIDVNDPPVAADDSATTSHNTAVTIDVLSNDSDPENDALTVISATNGTDGSVVNNGNDVTYTPDSDFAGTDSFDYTVSDGNGGTDTAAVSVDVLEPNVETVRFPGEGTAYIGYEDTEHGDFDYNDFGMTTWIEETYVDGCLAEINMVFHSVVHNAGDSHDIHILRTLDGSTTYYNYTITRTTAAQGTETSVSPASDEGDIDIVLFDTLYFTPGDQVTMHVEIIDGCEAYSSTPWDYYDPYMHDRTAGTVHDIADSQSAVAPLPLWPDGYDVPYILVIPVTGWQAPSSCITDLYPYFDDYYAEWSHPNWYLEKQPS